MQVRLRVLTRLTGPEARLCEKSVLFFVCNCSRCNSSSSLSRSANWRSDDDDGRKFFCASRTRTIRLCFSWELRRLAWGSGSSERVRPSVLSFFGFSFMVLKDMMRSTKVLRRQLLVDDTKMCSPMSGIETSFWSLLSPNLCHLHLHVLFPFSDFNVKRLLLVLCISRVFQQIQNNSQYYIHTCWFLKRCPVVLKPSFRTWILRVFFCRSRDLFQSSYLQM